jgi:hypothetical protein
MTDQPAFTTVSANLSPGDRLLLQHVFGEKDIDRIASQLARLALEEWLDWSKGVRLVEISLRELRQDTNDANEDWKFRSYLNPSYLSPCVR